VPYRAVFSAMLPAAQVFVWTFWCWHCWKNQRKKTFL